MTSTNGAAAVAVVVLVVVFGTSYYLPYRSITRAAIEQVQIAQQQQADAEKRANDQSERALRAKEELDQVRAQWQAARGQFANHMTQLIADAVRSESALDGKSQASVQELARQIVAQRDALKRQISEIKDNLDSISHNLDSDIDAINAALSPEPSNDDQLKELIARLNAQWGDKVATIDSLVEKTFLQLGSPRTLAATP